MDKANQIALDYAKNRIELREIKRVIANESRFYDVDLDKFRDHYNEFGYAWHGWVRALSNWNDQLDDNDKEYYQPDSIEYKFCELIDKKSANRREAGMIKRLHKETNSLIDDLIKSKRELIRSLRSESESIKRPIYAEITQLEIQKV